MKNAILPLCAALMLAAGAVHAADDPLLGTWKADLKTSLTVVLDGKPHTTQSAFGPIVSTCNRSEPHTLECKVNFGGSDSKSVFTLSADAKTLTEADTHEVVNVRASSSSNISEQNGKVTQGPASSHTQTTTSEETETTVFHKQ